jgi:hypothetical protein
MTGASGVKANSDLAFELAGTDSGLFTKIDRLLKSL